MNPNLRIILRFLSSLIVCGFATYGAIRLAGNERSALYYIVLFPCFASVLLSQYFAFSDGERDQEKEETRDKLLNRGYQHGYLSALYDMDHPDGPGTPKVERWYVCPYCAQIWPSDQSCDCPEAVKRRAENE